MIRNQSTLGRWSHFAPGTRLPDSLDELPLSQQLALKEQDPILHSLLAGSASAEVELSALDGSLSTTPMPPAERQQQERAARVAEILALNPGGSQGFYRENPDGSSTYVEPTAPNMDLMLELAQLDQAAWQQQELIRKPPAAAPDAQAAAQAAQAQAQQRVASLNHSIGAR